MTDRCECGHEADEHDATGHCQAAMLDDAGVSGPCYCDLYDPEDPE